MIELIDGNIKIVILIIFCLFEKLEERLNMLSTDKKDIFKRPKIELLKLKIIVSEMKNILHGINGRSGTSEQMINKLHKRKMNRVLMNCGTTSSGIAYMQLDSLRQRSDHTEKNVKRIAINFPNLMRSISLQI